MKQTKNGGEFRCSANG